MKNKELIIGSHVTLGAPNYLLGAVDEAISYGANTFMIYTGAPQNTNRKDVHLFKIEQAHALMKGNNIDSNNIIVHVPYIINLCSSKADTRKFGIDFLIEEIKRTEALGFNKLVLHPGSRLDQSIEQGLDEIIFGINTAIEKTKNSNVIIVLETMAGKGSELGTNISQLAKIIQNINNQTRIGVCLDTCHLSDSGININDFDQYLDEFATKIGLEYIKCIHINDSMNPIGSHKDRHQNIGYGYIGFDELIKVIYHPRLMHVPKILETPYIEINKKYYAPYKYEIEMIKNKHFIDWKKTLI